MKKSLLVVNTVVGAALLTLVTAAGSLLYLMLSTDEASVRRLGLFGSVFFETKQVRPGVTGAEMGLASAVPLVFVFLAFAVLMFLVQVAFVSLRNYRAELIAERSHS
jgi:hypothetical protein